MSVSDWAKKEVEIACARERAASKDSDEWEYGVACYESALKAFGVLMSDDHSGYSIGVTKNILVRLIEGKPLTPIEDTPSVWNEVSWGRENGEREYQCTRMSSLFKTVHRDGTVTYSDTDRVVVTYADNPDITWHNGQATRIVNEMFPITMPYWPSRGRYVVHGEEFLLDPANGDYDTLGYIFAKDPNGDIVDIGRYFAEKDHKWVEIDYQEYCERKLAAHDL
jgi:hypothetical protein